MRQVIATGLVAALLSSALTALLVLSLRPPAPPPGSDPEVAALRASLEEARDRLKTLQEAVERSGAAGTVSGGLPAAAPGAGGPGRVGGGGFDATMPEGKAVGGGPALENALKKAAGGVDPRAFREQLEKLAAAAAGQGVGQAQAEEDEEESDSQKQIRESALARTPAVTEKLREVYRWDESVALRQRWILTPEADVLSAFGKPDEVFGDVNGDERWNYRIPTGTTDDRGRPEWDDLTVVLCHGRLVRVYH